MVEPSTSPSKSKRKHPIVSSDESDDEPSGLRELLTEPEEVYQHTHTQTGTITPVNYSALAHGIEVKEAHSAIAESQASNSSVEKEAFAHMAGTPEEVAKRLEEQAHV